MENIKLATKLIKNLQIKVKAKSYDPIIILEAGQKLLIE